MCRAATIAQPKIGIFFNSFLAMETI